MIFIERYPLKRCQGCVKLIASKVNCFVNINDLSEVQLCMSSNSWTWECLYTKDGADHVPLIFSKLLVYLRTSWNVAEFSSMLPSDELPVLSSDSEPLSAKISAKISSFLSVSIMIAYTVRPTVPLDQHTGWKRTRLARG